MWITSLTIESDIAQGNELLSLARTNESKTTKHQTTSMKNLGNHGTWQPANMEWRGPKPITNGGFENPPLTTPLCARQHRSDRLDIDATPADGVQLATNSVFANNNGSQTFNSLARSYDKGGRITNDRHHA
jgi:hypothetical protein